MKRHPALQQLSRDHHHALAVAQRLKRTDAPGANDARGLFLEYWERDGRGHFREEEEVLLPTLSRFAELDQPVISRVLLDHVRIRRLAEDVAADAELADLHALGIELEQHVRREERELFPLIEQSLPEPELVALSERLARER
jgi:iron-sulfur cluster repair protein YtfE (RIC family)